MEVEVDTDRAQDSCFLVLNTEVKNININSLDIESHQFNSVATINGKKSQLN